MCRSSHLNPQTPTAPLSPLSLLSHLRDANDDVRVFAGVVLLVAAEHSNLTALQDVDLQRQEKSQEWSLLVSQVREPPDPETLKTPQTPRWSQTLLHHTHLDRVHPGAHPVKAVMVLRGWQSP